MNAAGDRGDKGVNAFCRFTRVARALDFVLSGALRAWLFRPTLLDSFYLLAFGLMRHSSRQITSVGRFLLIRLGPATK